MIEEIKEFFAWLYVVIAMIIFIPIIFILGFFSMIYRFFYKKITGKEKL
jgi:hypothetical protein